MFEGVFGAFRDICGPKARALSYAETRETVLVPHSKAPLQKGKKYTHDLGNLANERCALFTGKRKGDEAQERHVTKFSFELVISKALIVGTRPELCRLCLTVDGATGATLFLRFFYGLRNILNHGDPASTFGKSLNIFVNGTGFSASSPPDQATQNAMIKQVTRLLHQAGCTASPGSIRDVAVWMVGRITQFNKYRQHVWISTILLETIHGFLIAVSRAYLEGLCEYTRDLAAPRMWDVESLLPYT